MSTSDQRLTITAEADRGAIALSGELDAHSAPEFDTLLDGIDPATSLTVDLSGVTFIDSSGLRSLVAAHNARADAGGDLILDALSPPVTKLLDITGLADHLHVAGDE